MFIIKKNQSGQAMTEFVISAAFVLVPLFIIIPILGKYVDMKHTAIQAARYEAWEYTAHYSSTADQSSGFTSIANSLKPVKPVSRVQQEARTRFYSRTERPISTTADTGGLTASEINPLWRYRDGGAMYAATAPDTVSELRQTFTPDRTRVFEGVTRALGVALGFISSAMRAITGAIGATPIGFDSINTSGYYKATVSLPVAEPPGYRAFNLNNTETLFIDQRNLRMVARAGVVTNGWSAGGVAHAQSQARGLVPTALIGAVLNNPLPLQRIASTALLSPELDPDSLQFGIMNIDAVHPSALEGGGSHSCNGGGYCTY
jgi:hypothetical protein